LEWEKEKGISKTDVEAIIIQPEQVVPGDGDALVAQSRKYNGLIRIPYIEQQTGKKIITVYWTSKVSKYWEEK